MKDANSKTLAAAGKNVLLKGAKKMNINRKDPWLNISAAKNQEAYEFIKEYLRDKRGDYEGLL